MDCQNKAYIVTSIISLSFLIISLGLIFTQSIINIIYSFEMNKKIIAERLVYEQFSHEVYSNINSHPFTKIEVLSNSDLSCSTGELMRVPIKFEEFYDCGNDENIDVFCRNKITPESLCCHKSCCFEKVENKKESKYCLQKRELINNNDERLYYEPRESVCTKFSNYYGKFYKLCVQKSDKIYENFLDRNENNYYCSYNNPKLDSKGHCFYRDSSNNLEINNNNYPESLIVKNIYSTIEPNYFEMESKLRISMMLNKKNYNENKIKKEIKKISEISSKNIYEAFTDDECTGYTCSDNSNYNYMSDSSLSNIFNDEYIFRNYKTDDYYSNKNIYRYTRSYIGFQNMTELNKFKRFFDVNDHKNNCLFKISKVLYPNIESLIIGIIFIIFSIFCIFQILKNYDDININFPFIDFEIDYLILIVIIVLFLLYFLMYLIGYLVKFKEIDIDMEDFYKKVLKKYNYRRRQLFLMIAVIILAVDVLLELLKANIKYAINHKEIPNNVHSIIVQFKIEGTECKKEHKIKLYYNNKFSEYIPKIENKFKKCSNCEKFDINLYKIKERVIDEDKTIRDNNIEGENVIINCEE